MLRRLPRRRDQGFGRNAIMNEASRVQVLAVMHTSHGRIYTSSQSYCQRPNEEIASVGHAVFVCSLKPAVFVP